MSGPQRPRKARKRPKRKDLPKYDAKFEVISVSTRNNFLICPTIRFPDNEVYVLIPTPAHTTHPQHSYAGGKVDIDIGLFDGDTEESLAAQADNLDI